MEFQLNEVETMEPWTKALKIDDKSNSFEEEKIIHELEWTKPIHVQFKKTDLAYNELFSRSNMQLMTSQGVI